MTASDLEAALAYLIVKVLAGNKNKILAIYEYLVLDKSIREVKEKYGFSKSQIKGWSYRLMRYRGAKKLLAKTINDLLEIEPIITKDNICKICKAQISDPERHVLKHKFIVNRHIQKILEKLK